MKAKAYRILHESTGQAMVEAAMVLPLLVLLVIGVFEFSRSIQANNIVVAMSREAANLASRPPTPPSQDIMDAVGDTAQPLVMTAHGMIYITKVQGVKIGKYRADGCSKLVRPGQMGTWRLQRGQQNRDSPWNKLPRDHPQPYTPKWRGGLRGRGFL